MAKSGKSEEFNDLQGGAEWTKNLLFDRKKDGERKIRQCTKNWKVVLCGDERFAGKIRFDEFLKQLYLDGEVPWEGNAVFRPWTSCDDAQAIQIIQAEYRLTNRADFYDAIKNVGHENCFHAVRDFLDTLAWDGQEHISNLLPDFLGAERSTYTGQVLRLWMQGAVARIYEPGTKFDYTLILTGRQGLGKSTFLNLLALKDEWFNDSLDSLDSEKSVQQLIGSWIVELSELKSLSRTAGGADSVKRFLTAKQDKYRMPYGKRAEIFPRQCVFAGTTNKSDFLEDDTGNRRFLVVRVGVQEPKKSLFAPGAINEIKAAWAQAVAAHKETKPALTLPENLLNEAKEIQHASEADTGLRGVVEDYLEDENKTKVCALMVWRDALGQKGLPTKRASIEINHIIENLPEWTKKSSIRFEGYGRQRGYVRSVRMENVNDLKDKNTAI